jgi:hypothetical protein
LIGKSWCHSVTQVADRGQGEDGGLAEALAEQAQATNTKLDALMEQLASLTPWVKNMDASMVDLSTTTAMLKLHAEDTAARLGALESRPPPAPTPAEPLSTALPSGEVMRRPDGHGYDNMSQGQIREIPGSCRFPSENGMIVPHPHYREYGEDEHFDRSSSHSRYHSTPKMDFPKFDGTDPTIWKDNCEMYFKIYGISEMMKVKFAMLNFVGNAALWLKTVQSKQYIIHWKDLHKAVEIYWGKNKFNFFMRRILTLVEKWTSIPVPEGHLYWKSNRYKRFGTKAPPSLVPVPYKPVLKGPPRWLPGECRARDLWYRFVTRTGTKGIQGLGF